MANNNKLRLVAIEPDGLVHAAAEGDLAGADARAAGVNGFESLLGANWRAGRVMVDLGRCTLIDSAAIGWLVESNKQFKNAGGKLVLYGLPSRVRQVMELLKLQRLLHLAASETAARSIFCGGVAAVGERALTEAGR